MYISILISISAIYLFLSVWNLNFPNTKILVWISLDFPPKHFECFRHLRKIFVTSKRKRIKVLHRTKSKNNLLYLILLVNKEWTYRSHNSSFIVSKLYFCSILFLYLYFYFLTFFLTCFVLKTFMAACKWIQNKTNYHFLFFLRVWTNLSRIFFLWKV